MPTVVPDGRAGTEQIVAELVAMFSRAEKRLLDALSAQVRIGLERDPGDVARAIKVQRLRELASAIASELDQWSADAVLAAVMQAATLGAVAARTEVANVAPAAVPEMTAAEVAVVVSSAPAAILVAAELTSTMRAVTRRIVRWPDDVYRQATAQAAQDTLLGLASRRAEQARAWQRLTAAGVDGFVDASGRRWALSSYVEMATRTAVRRAWDAQHEQTMTAVGVTLATIVVGDSSCKACAEWSGRVLRVGDGQTGEISVPDTLDPTAVVHVHVDATLSDARAHGWQHPNCRCRVVPYMAGLSSIPKATTYDPQAEADRQRLRLLERRVREAKRELGVAVSSGEKARLRARIRSLQAQIREHVADTGQKRQSYREQVDLGMRG